MKLNEPQALNKLNITAKLTTKTHRGFVLSVDALFAVIISFSLISVLFVILQSTQLSAPNQYDFFGRDVSNLMCNNAGSDIAFENEKICGYSVSEGLRKDYCSCKEYKIYTQNCLAEAGTEPGAGIVGKKTVEVGWCRI